MRIQIRGKLEADNMSHTNGEKKKKQLVMNREYVRVEIGTHCS